MFSRRTMLGGVAAAGVSIVGVRAFAQTASPLTAVVRFNDGRTFTYSESTGRDLGDFVSDIGGFTQRCVRGDVPGLPLTVFFRPDRGSDRVEVVFELGRVFGATPANLEAYTASIYRGDVLLASVNVPAHYWYSRWRWQSSPRPIVGNVASLIGQNLLPPYDTAGGTYVSTPVTTCASPPSNPSHPKSKKLICTTTYNETFQASTTLPAVMTAFTPYTVMGLSDVTAYMPRTGERADIGLVTEPQAQYICTGSSVALGAVRAWAEAAGTVPWHIRDEVTGAPINLRTYPDASWYWDQRVANPWIRLGTSPVTPDTAHQPSLAYLPYMLTGDPYHLEDMHFAANWDWGSLPPRYRPGIGQSRAFAWYIRTLSQCARVTPAVTPSWILPQSYWKGFLDQNRAHLETAYVESSAPVRALFRSTADITYARDEGPTAPAGTWIDPWQDEFLGAVMACVLRMGFSDWRTAYDWKLGTTIARTNATSGWVRAYATPYRIILRETSTSPMATSWAEAWALTQRIRQIPTVTNTDTWADPDRTYLTYTRGVLALAEGLGVPGVSASLGWATQQLRNAGWRTAYKWRLGSGL